MACITVAAALSHLLEALYVARLCSKHRTGPIVGVSPLRFQGCVHAYRPPIISTVTIRPLHVFLRFHGARSIPKENPEGPHRLYHEGELNIMLSLLNEYLLLLWM